MRYYLLFFLIAAFLAGCATTSGVKSKKGSRYIITEEEINASSANNAYEIVQLLRPMLLNQAQMRSADLYSAVESVVFVNNVRHGIGSETLRTIPAFGILKIEYLKPSEATTRYGTGLGGGAFLITLK